MNDQDYNERFGQEPEFSGVRVIASMILLVAIAAFLLFCAFAVGPIKANETCALETQEARITEAIEQYKPTVWIFESAGLNTFMQSLAEWGLMVGRPTNVDKVYVTLYEGNYTLFFLFKGCIVAAYHGPASVMERILPK
jgi:hypothetical protein